MKETSPACPPRFAPSSPCAAFLLLGAGLCVMPAGFLLPGGPGAALFFGGLALAVAGFALTRHRTEEAARTLGALTAQASAREQAEETLAARQREVEAGAQNLAATNALLAQASGRFQELFQGLPVACVCYDGSGRIMEWNRAFEQRYGLGNVWGRTAREVMYAGAEAPQLAEAVAAALAGEHREGVEWTRTAADGTPSRLYCSIFPLRGADGAVTGAISADIDISAQHEAEEALRRSEERMHALYNMTSQQGLTFEQKTQEVLALGGAHFGLEFAVLARVTGEEYEVVQAVAPEGLLPPGTTFPVCDVYCAEALRRADAVSFEQAGLTERREMGIYKMTGMEAYLGTPVRVGGAVWGMLCFTSRRPYPRRFTSGDRELVRLMAQWVGGEIARRQAEEAVQASEERFRVAIAAMSEGLIVMDQDGVIRLWNESAERILEMTRGGQHGWRPLNPEFTAVREDGSSFPEGSYPLMRSLRRGEAQQGVVMGLPRTGGGMLWVSVSVKPLFRPGEGGPPDRPCAVVATFADITERRRCEGQIAVQMAQIRDYNVALEARKRELEAANVQLEALAMHDGLTGLGNRRALEQRLALEVSRAQRYSAPLSLLLLDVDFFKDYNDTFGHPAGDAALCLLADVLRAQGRDTDFFARFGGEEFVAVLPQTDAAGALALAERLRRAAEDARWPEGGLTVSLGAATLAAAMADPSALVLAADRALYASKEAGRNRASHAQSLPEPAAPPLPARR